MEMCIFEYPGTLLDTISANITQKLFRNITALHGDASFEWGDVIHISIAHVCKYIRVLWTGEQTLDPIRRLCYFANDISKFISW